MSENDLSKGYPSFISLSAKTKVQVAFFPKAMVDRMVERCPLVLLTLAKRLMKHVSPLVLQIDLALEWVQVSAGQVLYRQDDISDSIYYVLSGRLRCIIEPNYKSTYVPRPSQKKRNTSDLAFEHAFGSPLSSDTSPVGSPDILILPPTSDGHFEILAEYGQNDSIGERQVLAQLLRPGTLYAIRDTELTVMSKILFEALASLNPLITLQISKIIAHRSHKEQHSPSPQYKTGIQNGVSCHYNLRSVAIMPTHGYVPVSEFAQRLARAASLLGDDVIVVDTETVMNALGKHAFTRLGRLKLNSWLSEQEESCRLVLYVADGGVNNPWTVRCVRQVLFVC
jgi:lysophospholipid hydrolase